MHLLKDGFLIWTFSAARFRSDRKRRLEGEEHFRGAGGNRDWLQVLCNGGAATELALLYLVDVGAGADLPLDFRGDYRASWLGSAVLGALACCCGDTWASEVGSVWSDSEADLPRLVSSGRRVPRGTNGAVSPIGLLLSLLGGAAVGAGYCSAVWAAAPAAALARGPPQAAALLVGAAAGLLGSLLDSLLGALLQYSGRDRRTGAIVERPGPNVEHISGVALLDNHGVNLVSSVVTAVVTPYIAMPLFS